MPTNFHLAPPAKLVDGLFAVPIDIQSIVAPLVFDGSTQTGTGDATMTFVMPDPAGCPIFDLRQTITAAWLDGVAIPVADVAHHNFGGGVNAELRVVNTTLTANTTHTLRVTCQLGIPQTATAGSPSKPGTSGLHNRPDLFTGADNVVEVALPDQPVNDTQNGESEHLDCGIQVPEPGPGG